jgi:hypothetical protein
VITNAPFGVFTIILAETGERLTEIFRYNHSRLSLKVENIHSVRGHRVLRGKIR